MKPDKWTEAERLAMTTLNPFVDESPDIVRLRDEIVTLRRLPPDPACGGCKEPLVLGSRVRKVTEILTGEGYLVYAYCPQCVNAMAEGGDAFTLRIRKGQGAPTT